MFRMYYQSSDDQDTKKPASAEIIDKTDRLISEQLKAGFPTMVKVQTKPEKKKDQTKPDQQEAAENKEP